MALFDYPPDRLRRRRRALPRRADAWVDVQTITLSPSKVVIANPLKFSPG